MREIERWRNKSVRHMEREMRRGEKNRDSVCEREVRERGERER